jgi:hypothetical protein
LNCRQGNIFKKVYDPKRFKVLSTCEHVIGTVRHVSHEPDGDYKFDLKVKGQYKKLAKGNNGDLVVEIIPKDQHHSSGIVLPKNGDKIEVYGAWVIDKPQGWNEIHPAWKVIILEDHGGEDSSGHDKKGSEE